MIDVLKRLAELDSKNPNVAQPTLKEDEVIVAVIDAPKVITEGKEVEINLPEPNLDEMKMLSGVKKQLNESAIAECGMSALGAPMPPMMPASINMSAGNAGEIVSMMRGIMDLAKSDMPTAMPMGDVDSDGDHDMKDHDLEAPDAGPLTAEPEDKKVSGPTFGDDSDDSGDDELANMMKKLKTGEPVKITTDMPVKVKSDNPMKALTDKLNKIDGEAYDNEPADPNNAPAFDADKMAYKPNQAKQGNRMDGTMPMGNPKDEGMAFEQKLWNDYQQFIKESQ